MKNKKMRIALFCGLRGSEWAVAAMPAAEAFRNQFGWIVFLSYPFMLPFCEETHHSRKRT